MKRGLRSFAVAALALFASVSLCAAAEAKRDRRVIVLGMDGLDPKLVQRWVDEGKLPNLSRLIASGSFAPLETSMPPLSPIAWSSFITGMDPGGHGIYDFVHRDPATYLPEFAMTRTEKGRSLELFDKCLPLVPGEPVLLRHGRAFWEILDEHGVETVVFGMPVNFPPVALDRGLFDRSRGRALSGMGTPDLQGTPGMFSYYAERPPPDVADMSGGDYYPVIVRGGRVEAKLVGPKNPIDCERTALEVPFTVDVDAERDVARIRIGTRDLVLAEGEWSDWVRVDFTAVPVLASVSGLARFYMKEVAPSFKLYVSPIQINPEDPALPISDPPDWSHELWEHLGYFHTKELPEDSKAFMNDVLDGHEFRDQAEVVYRERRRALDWLLERFERGLLFVYFSSADQQSHMFWRYMDPTHPGHVEDPLLAQGIEAIYRELDEAVGRTLREVDERTTLIVMSDHGFAPFNRGVSLNSWLRDRGYQKRKGAGEGKFFLDVDWSATRAYAVGLNGLYLNLRGREAQGTVEPADYDAVLDGIERELLELVDPATGNRAITLVTRPRRDFRGAHVADGPDIIVGYAWGYRADWDSPLGAAPAEIFSDNRAAWSGDHSMDYRLVPGTLIANRPLSMSRPALYDLTVAILDEFGIAAGEGMIGRDCLGP